MSACQYCITRTSLLPCSVIHSKAVPVHDMTIYVAVGVGIGPCILKSNFGRNCSGLLIPGISGTHGTDDLLDSTMCLRDICSPALYCNSTPCPLATHVVIRYMLFDLLTWVPKRQPSVLLVAGKCPLEMYEKMNKWTWMCGGVRYHLKYHKTKFHILYTVLRSCHSYVIISKSNYRPTFKTSCINRTLIEWSDGGAYF